jgi:hypothetical protein
MAGGDSELVLSMNNADTGMPTSSTAERSRCA